MERRYDLDAISYLVDPPRGLAAGWAQGVSRDRLREMMRSRAAILRRELEDLESDLRVLEEEERQQNTGTFFTRLVRAFQR